MKRLFRLLAFLAVSASLPARGQDAIQSSVPRSGDSPSATPLSKKIPERALLATGAWSSTSDSTTPLPEGGSVANGAYTNAYFGFSYKLPAGWMEKAAGSPPSATGSYALTLLTPADNYKGSGRGTILVTAQDMFFTPIPLANAVELLNYTKAHLQGDLKVELEPTVTMIAGQPFTSFAYWSPGTALYWHVLATEIRCHTVQFILMNRDPKTLESLVQEVNRLNWAAIPSETGAGRDDAPVCIKDYARGENVLERNDPVFPEHRFNPVPVRIIIDKEGKVRHIHFLTAFPDQAKTTTDALAQWRFKPYLRDGKPVEVETGIIFGPERHLAKPPVREATQSNSMTVASQR
ncbi:MAG TPA: energy transducer TonB [Bryobacteraceae bacterium]|nr:energy transducer TonB [Bryobacteraceae bacterium]